MTTRTYSLGTYAGGLVTFALEYDDVDGEVCEIRALLCDNGTAGDVSITLSDRVSGRSRARTFGPGQAQRVAIPVAQRPSILPGTRLARAANRITKIVKIPA